MTCEKCGKVRHVGCVFKYGDPQQCGDLWNACHGEHAKEPCPTCGKTCHAGQEHNCKCPKCADKKCAKCGLDTVGHERDGSQSCWCPDPL